MRRLIYYTLIHMKDRESITIVQIKLNPHSIPPIPSLLPIPIPVVPILRRWHTLPIRCPAPTPLTMTILLLIW
jgi:hypothetical protein